MNSHYINYPCHASFDGWIPEELELFMAETAEDLEISPEELVQQTSCSYCNEKLGRRHE